MTVVRRGKTIFQLWFEGGTSLHTWYSRETWSTTKALASLSSFRSKVKATGQHALPRNYHWPFFWNMTHVGFRYQVISLSFCLDESYFSNYSHLSSYLIVHHQLSAMIERTALSFLRCPYQVYLLFLKWNSKIPPLKSFHILSLKMTNSFPSRVGRKGRETAESSSSISVKLPSVESWKEPWEMD